MDKAGSIAPHGDLTVHVIRNEPRAEWWRNLWALALPHRGLPREVNAWRLRNLRHLWRGLWRVSLAHILGLPTVFGALYVTVIKADGRRLNYGMASMRLVTNTGAGYLVDAMQNIVEAENLKYHALGTGTNAEAAGDSALQTEITTQYNPDNTRATGSTTEASAQVFRSVGTNTVDAGVACTEHGLLTQAATGGGVLLDRSVFSVINLVATDSFQTTYDFTINSGN